MSYVRDIKRVAVIGAGQMGHGIAQVFAQAGLPVMLHDVSEEKVQVGLEMVRANLDMFIANDLIAPEEADKAYRRIEGTTDLSRAVQDADFIEEAVYEDLSLKREVYYKIEKACRPDTIIASNTSGLMPTDLAAQMEHPERFLVAHFWKPPYLVRLVEVVAGQKTALGLAEHVSEFLQSAKKKPVILRKEVPGFIGNRIQYAIVREATHMIDQGMATPEDVDMAIVEGFGIRFSFAGICRINDAQGLDLIKSISSYIMRELGSSTEVPKVVADKVAAGDLGVKTGKGYYEWTPESVVEFRGVWDRALIEQMKKRGR